MLITTLALASLAAPAAPAPADDSIAWHSDTFFSALGAAGERGTNVVVYFWMNGSEQCSRLYGQTMADPAVAKKMNELVCFSANTGDPKGYKLVERFNVTTLPTMLVVTPKGEVEDGVFGFIDPGGLVGEMDRIQSGKDTISDFRRRIAETPDDMELKYQFSIKLADCGDEDGHHELTEAIKRDDPKGKHVVAARFHLQDLQNSVVETAKKGDSEYDFKGVSLKPLEKFLAHSKHDEIRFKGWSWASAVHKEAEDLASSRSAAMKAWSHVGDDSTVWYGGEVVRSFWKHREELSKKEKKFALTVANVVLEKGAEEREHAKTEAMKCDSGCMSFDGCKEGEGCGGCGGQKSELIAREARELDLLACSLFLNGKKRKAVETIEKSIALAPESEDLKARLASFRGEG